MEPDLGAYSSMYKVCMTPLCYGCSWNLVVPVAMSHQFFLEMQVYLRAAIFNCMPLLQTFKIGKSPDVPHTELKCDYTVCHTN